MTHVSGPPAACIDRRASPPSRHPYTPFQIQFHGAVHGVTLGVVHLDLDTVAVG